MDWLIDRITGDLDLTRTPGSVTAVDGDEAILQKIRVRYLFFKGEWYLDTRQGVPWFQEIFVKNPNMGRVNFLLRQVLVTCPGVASVTSFRLSDIERTTRRIQLSFRVVLDSGRVIDSSSFGPFILDFKQVGL